MLSAVCAAVLMLSSSPYASAENREKKDVVFHDATEFRIGGKAVEKTLSPYDRLPASYETTTRKELWRLGRNTAGLYVRFRTDSPVICAKWKSRSGNVMSHMAPSGIRGLDLYFLEDGTWHFAGTGRPDKSSLVTEAVLARDMDRKPREWMLYLSLYDGIESLEIGVDPSSSIGVPQTDSPRSGSPIVMYGSSILQGGCVSRPGMLETSLIERALDIEVVNLGFSGNALLDMDIAQLMASVEKPALYVLDYVPNSRAGRIAESGEAFFRVLRDAHPDVPVIFVEKPNYPTELSDNSVREETAARNNAQRALYEKLRKAGEKRIWYVPADNLLDAAGEGTVDGTHFTDLGVTYYAAALLPVIRKALKSSPNRPAGLK